jgi:hypothetical protein
MPETPSDPYERFLDQLGRPFRRFLLLVVALLIVVSVGALVFQRSAIAYATGIPLLLVAYCCPELVLGMFRCELDGAPASWDQLATRGRVARVAMTVFGTALLLAPFVGVGWWVLR